eukprot:3465378-Rhodomonas_salina.2
MSSAETPHAGTSRLDGAQIPSVELSVTGSVSFLPPYVSGTQCPVLAETAMPRSVPIFFFLRY